MRFVIKIGSAGGEFGLFATSAPNSYDGFGTFTIREDEGRGEGRHVLVDARHEDWQLSRYASGLKSANPVPEDVHLRQWVECELWNRMISAEEEA